MAREAARLRTATGRAGTIAATDAIVAAYASTLHAPVILTSDPTDLTALADHAVQPIAVSRLDTQNLYTVRWTAPVLSVATATAASRAAAASASVSVRSGARNRRA